MNISIFAGAVNVGAVVSWIVNVPIELIGFPLASVAVNVTVAVPVEPQPSLRPV